MQSGHYRHRPVLYAFKRGMPHAGMKQTLACIALAQLAQIQTCTKVLTLAINHCGPHRGRQVLEHIAKGQNEAVVQGVALGEARQTDNGNFILFAANFEVEVFSGHDFFRTWLNYGYEI
jgi:hypothetical protein